MNNTHNAASYPVYLIGAGGIVNDAHLPAYKLMGYDVKGIFDKDHSKASATAERFGIPKVFETINDLIHDSPAARVFDVAVPASQLRIVLEQLPSGAAVLMQKPMGENLDDAVRILELTRRKKMIAAVNFQLRYAPYVAALRKMVNEGELGEINDVEINVNVYTPWHLWDFLFSSSRVEILYHSIHYIDLVRSFLGNPDSIYAKSTGHPSMEALASVRSNIIMDYGRFRRANILTNHCHNFGTTRQQSYIKFEGSKGAVRIEFGLLKNYPAGEADRFEYALIHEGEKTGWLTKEIEGTWFPHAFGESMNQVMECMAGRRQRPDNSVEDAIDTMACVEAAYQSSEAGGIQPSFNKN